MSQPWLRASLSTWPTRCGFAVLIALLVACESKSTPASSSVTASGATASSSAPRGEPTPPPAVSPAPASYPADLALDQVKRELACGRGTTKHSCNVVSEFAKAQRFTGKTPSGESRWLGRAQVVQAGKEHTEYWVLYIHTVPTARVGANSLPLMLGMSPLPPHANRDAGRIFGTLSRGRHRANRKDPIMRLVETYEPKTERGLINTTGESAQTIGQVSEDIAYLRQPELKKLLYIRPALGMDAKPGDGSYAEFWQTAW